MPQASPNEKRGGQPGKYHRPKPIQHFEPIKMELKCTEEIFDGAAQSLGYADWEEYRASDDFLAMVEIPAGDTASEMLRHVLGEASN